LKRKNQVIELRRKYVFEMASKGDSQVEIARKLQVHESTISNDLDYLREESTQNIRKYIDKILPLEYDKTLAGLTAILKEMWTASEKAGQDTREKVLALSLAKEIYSMKLDLLSNVSTVEAAMKFISEYKIKLQQQQDNQEEQISSPLTAVTETEVEPTTTTTNQVF
jgi:predicted transcriptional regulator